MVLRCAALHITGNSIRLPAWGNSEWPGTYRKTKWPLHLAKSNTNQGNNGSATVPQRHGAHDSGQKGSRGISYCFC